MRHAVSYLLFFVFLWQLAGVNVSFERSYYLVKKEIKLALKNGVPDDQRISFIFNKAEFESLTWVKSNEFIFEGHYFDVINTSYESDTYRLSCISDEKETQLFKDLNEQVNKNLGDNSKDLPHNKMKKINKVYFGSENQDVIFEFSSFYSGNNYPLLISHISTGFIRRDELPPSA